jgi:hypothetical protein
VERPPGLLFDLGARKFYIFGIVLWPQDFIYLAALLIISAYLLFRHGHGRAGVVRLRLSANGVHRNLPVDRAQDRRQAQRPHGWTGSRRR